MLSYINAKCSLLYNHFHRSGKFALYSIRSYSRDARDIESAVALQFTERILLTCRELCPIAYHRNGISHIVEEHRLKTQHLKANVENAVVDGCSNAINRHKAGLRHASASISHWVAMLVVHGYISCRIGQFADTECEPPHLLRLTSIC